MPILAAKDVTVPQQLDEKHRRTHRRLSKMRGAEFDRAYMRDMVEDHEKDVKKFRQEAEHANDADLKGFAQQTLPVLEQHLEAGARHQQVADRGRLVRSGARAREPLIDSLDHE